LRLANDVIFRSSFAENHVDVDRFNPTRSIFKDLQAA
jgi:hypothetical protein